MKGKFDAYVLWPLAQNVQNWIVDRSNACDFMNLIIALLNKLQFVSIRKYKEDHKSYNGLDSMLLTLPRIWCLAKGASNVRDPSQG